MHLGFFQRLRCLKQPGFFGRSTLESKNLGRSKTAKQKKNASRKENVANDGQKCYQLMILTFDILAESHAFDILTWCIAWKSLMLYYQMSSFSMQVA